MAVTFNTSISGISQVTQVYTVATIPSASSVLTGFSAFVSDALAPALLAVVVGGGAVIARVFSDGTNWRVG